MKEISETENRQGYYYLLTLIGMVKDTKQEHKEPLEPNHLKVKQLLNILDKYGISKICELTERDYNQRITLQKKGRLDFLILTPIKKAA